MTPLYKHALGQTSLWEEAVSGPFLGQERCPGPPPLSVPMPTSLKPGMMAAARVSSGLSPSLGGTGNLQAQTGNEALASAFFPYKPRATEIARPELKPQKVNRAGPSCVGEQRGGAGMWDIHPYLYAVQLLGQDAEKVIGEVAQQWRVPVPIAPLAGRGCGAQHIDAGG